MAASQELIDAVIVRISNGEKIWEAMQAENVVKEDRREVRIAATQYAFRTRLQALPLRILEQREAMMMNRLQIVTEIIAEKMGSSSTS